jgi:uncharacterized cupredoxin-like copper-binding protein
MSARQPLAGLLALLVGAVTVAACGGATPTPTAAPPTSQSVAVTLQEWAVVPASTSVASGGVTFAVTNSGPDDVHEFVVVRTDLAAGSLPTDGTGAVDESGGGMEVVNEIEDIPVGQTQELTVTLTPGSYVLICNIYDEGEAEAHYQLGMRIGFTVTN